MIKDESAQNSSAFSSVELYPDRYEQDVAVERQGFRDAEPEIIFFFVEVSLATLISASLRTSKQKVLNKWILSQYELHAVDIYLIKIFQGKRLGTILHSISLQPWLILKS